MAVNSCGTALDLCMMALGIGPGDEVIVSAYGWGQTVAAVLYVCMRRTWIFSLAEREIVYGEGRRFAGKAKSVLRLRR